jgi:hypothetical protein
LHNAGRLATITKKRPVLEHNLTNHRAIVVPVQLGLVGEGMSMAELAA